MQLGETDQAMETYNMALVLNPALVDAHNNLGNLFIRRLDLPEMLFRGDSYQARFCCCLE